MAGAFRVVKTEDNVLAMIEDTCRGRAPLFTQQHEILELTGEQDADKMAFRVRAATAALASWLPCLAAAVAVTPRCAAAEETWPFAVPAPRHHSADSLALCSLCSAWLQFQEALDGPSDWPDDVPRPMVMMNWQTLAMKRACEAVIVEQEVDIAEMVFLGVNAPAETNIDLAEVSDEICIEVTAACSPDTRKSTGTKKRKVSGFVHAAKGKRVAQAEDRQAADEAVESERVAKLARASTANAAARQLRCPLCLLLVEDLWAKVLGMGFEASPLTTEDQMFDLIDKACGKGGRPVPFRGAYLLKQEIGGDGVFALRRRDTPVPASQVPGDGWEADALKIGCQDFVASMETDIAEQFYLMVEGRETALKENKTMAAAMQAAGKPMFERLCESRCAQPKPSKKKKKRKKAQKSEL